MARRVKRAERSGYLSLPQPEKRRPVMVLSRSTLIALLHTVTVAAVTSTRRGSPTEVDVGPDEGVKPRASISATSSRSDSRTSARSLAPSEPTRCAVSAGPWRSPRRTFHAAPRLARRDGAVLMEGITAGWTGGSSMAWR